MLVLFLTSSGQELELCSEESQPTSPVQSPNL